MNFIISSVTDKRSDPSAPNDPKGRSGWQTQMQKNFLKIFILILITGAFLTPSFVSAGIFSEIGSKLNIFNQEAGLPGTREVDAVDVIINIVNVILGLLGLIFVILIIYAGFTWMTAQGDKDKVQKAKDTIKNSIYGVVIILFAYILANWVIEIVVDLASGKTDIFD